MNERHYKVIFKQSTNQFIAVSEIARSRNTVVSENLCSESSSEILVGFFSSLQLNYSESDLKIGQFSRVKSPLFDLLNTIESAAKNDRASDRLKAANAMSLAAQGYNLYDTASKMLTKDPKSNYLSGLLLIYKTKSRYQ